MRLYASIIDTLDCGSVILTMYTQLSIENLRGIRSLTLDRLARVNLLIGGNSVGKTTVLEATWLLRGAGNPELPLNIAVQRGGKPVFAPAPESHWLTLFPNLGTDLEILLSGVVDGGNRESLKLRALSGSEVGVYSNGGSGKTNFEEAAAAGRISTTELPRYSFQMTFTDSTNGETVSTFDVIRERAHILPNPHVTRPAVLLSDRASSDAGELAALFSKCQDRGRIPEIVEGLRVVDPSLTDLSLGYSIQENRPVVYMHRSGIEGRLPFDISGGGGRRVLEMLISILSEDDIPVMIDEFESGIHYANLERVWRIVDRASQLSGCQLIVTTHSLECIHAAVDAFRFENPEDLRIFRLERDDDQIDIVDYDFDVALAAAEANLEMR